MAHVTMSTLGFFITACSSWCSCACSSNYEYVFVVLVIVVVENCVDRLFTETPALATTTRETSSS